VAYLRNPYRLRCPLCSNEPGCNLSCADDLRSAIEEETTGHVAAFIAEPVQGVGGLVEAPLGYFERIKEILDKTGISSLSPTRCRPLFERTGSPFREIEAFDVEAGPIRWRRAWETGCQ
jgi:adenosylmethionine-8-amino-7-oxononanoate aminotransferase